MDNLSPSKKSGVVIFGQHFCDQLEHIPIKKRISLRDSALYQPNPSSTKALDQKVDSPDSSPCRDPCFLSKQQSDNLLTGDLDVNRSHVPFLNDEKAGYPPDFSHIETLEHSSPSEKIYMSGNGNKVPSTEAVPPCTVTTLLPVSSNASDSKNDGFGIKSSEHVKHLASDMIGDSYPDGKASIQPDPPCNDLKTTQSVTQDARKLWDLNVEMDEWEKPIDDQNVESLSDLTVFELTDSAKHGISEDFKFTEKTKILLDNAEDDTQPTCTSVNSASVCGRSHMIPESTCSLGCESVSNGQQVASGACLDRSFSDTEPSQETESNIISCNQRVSSKTDEHSTPKLGGSGCKSSDVESRRDSGSLFETTSYCTKSSELQDFENKNYATRSEISGVDNGSSKSKTNANAGQLEVAFVDSSDHCVGLLKEEYLMKTFSGNTMHPSNQMTENSPQNAYETLGSFQEGYDASFAEPLCLPGKGHQDATIFKQVVSIDKICDWETDQEYEDGELRDMDMHCRNEMETEMGETECLDYEPVAGNAENLDESSTSVSVVGNDEDQLKRKEHRSSETLKKQLMSKDISHSDKKMIRGLYGDGARSLNMQLKGKFSGWDQLPKDDQTSLDKVQKAHLVSSRMLKGKLLGSGAIPTLAEDAEEKETVVGRTIRPKDMDNSFSADSGSGLDKFSGKRRSPHMHGRTRVEDWDSENHSSVNYHDKYDNPIESRPLIMNFKGRERPRSRSPSARTKAYDPCINYSSYSRGRFGRHAEGSAGRIVRGGTNGYRGSFTDGRSESEFDARQQFIKRDGSFSPRSIPKFSENFDRSWSRPRTRSPPIWLPQYERMGSRGHSRSPKLGTEDRVKRIRLPFWESSMPSDKELRHASPPRGGFIAHNKRRWNDDFDMGGHRYRSPRRRFGHKEKFNASCSGGRFKPSEDFRSSGYRGRMREIASPDRVRGYTGGSDRRKREYSFEAGRQKRFYRDGFARQYQQDSENDTEAQNYPSKVDFLGNDETRIGNVRKKENIGHDRQEYGQQSYPGSTPNIKT